MTIVFLYFLWIWNLAYIPAHRWTQYILITHIIYL
jgi:drug/metabolite transporter (DMT)-like permease